MRLLKTFAVAAAIVLGQGVALAAEPLQTTPLPIDALANIPALQGVTMSPNGRYVAALVQETGKKQPVVSIWDLDDLKKPAVHIPSNGVQRPRGVRFLGNDNVLVSVDQPLTVGACKHYAIRQQAVTVDGKQAGAFFDFPASEGCGIFDGGERLPFQAGNFQDPNRFLLNSARGGVYAIDPTKLRYRGNNVDADLSTVARSSDQETITLADVRDGQLMVKELIEPTGDGWKIRYEIRNRASGAWEDHPELSVLAKNRYTMTPLCFCDPDANKLYIATNKPIGGDSPNYAQVRVYDIVTREWDKEPLLSSPKADILGVIPALDWQNKKVVGIRAYIIGTAEEKVVYLDDYWAALQKSLEAQFPGQSVNFIGDLNRTKGRAVIEISGPSNPPVYYVMFDSQHIQLLGKSNPAIDPKTLGTTKYVSFAARDGLEIPALLTLPPGYDKAKNGPIPTVVLPHGGPWARDALDWDASGWPQFLTTRGYAVIQPQYRGSDGWGLKLWKAGDQEWGQKMSDDNDDAAKWLVDQGVADPKKLAIFGYSYGGFAAIAASVRPNSPYKCAISGAGVADLQRISNSWGEERLQREIQGWTVAGMDPMKNVSKANIPIMLYHGDRDRQADTVHSREFYSAMKGAGKDVEFHEIKDMWHQLPWYPEWHRETLGLIEKYLAGPKCFGG